MTHSNNSSRLLRLLSLSVCLLSSYKSLIKGDEIDEVAGDVRNDVIGWSDTMSFLHVDSKVSAKLEQRDHSLIGKE